jgi:nucleotide-binding universal stress UspA family protein
VGKPAEVIVEIAAADPATLVTMATHGRSGIQLWLLGSVAHKVLHTTRNPLFLVRPTEKIESSGMACLGKVIVPLDGSSLAEKVLPYVAALAKKMDMEILLLQTYGLPPAVHNAAEGGLSNLEHLLKQMREEAQVYLDQILQRLRLEGLQRVSTLIFEGNAAEHIIEVARKTPNSLVAMCTHGRSGVARFVLGSVTDKVVHHCGHPVLVIRASSESK